MSRVTKLFKIIYYVFLAFIIAVAILLIFSVFPIAGNYRIMVVQSSSMEPAIKLGAIVVAKPAKEYKVGDVITFKASKESENLITHRIIEIKKEDGKIFYKTKGDASEDPDITPILKERVVGKVLFSIPYLGYAVAAAKKPYGFALIVIVPAAIIIIDEIKNIISEVKKMRKK